jgi:hypothetical protein
MTRAISALPPKADIIAAQTNVRFVPKADSCTAAKSPQPDLGLQNGGFDFLILRQRSPEKV